MRLCTHEAYRKNDLLLGVFEFVGMDVLQSGRRYVLGCTEKKLLPLYLKLGFEDTKIIYPNPDLNNISHHIILMDVAAIASGRMNPISWNMIWSATCQHAYEDGLVPLNDFAAINVRFFMWLRPLTNWIYRKFIQK